jgi:hypothetical protein
MTYPELCVSLILTEIQYGAISSVIPKMHARGEYGAASTSVLIEEGNTSSQSIIRATQNVSLN